MASKNKRSLRTKVSEGTTAKDSPDGSGRGSWTAGKTVAEIRRVYKANTNQAFAASAKKYLRDQFDFFGLRTPIRHQLDAEIAVTVDFDCWTGQQLHSLLLLLWCQKEREFQLYGVDLARKHLKTVLYDFDQAVSLLEKMITTKSWWDTVDMIASHLVGGLVKAFPGRGRDLMDAWIDHDDLWIRRSAILHQLDYKKNCRDDILFRYCLRRAHETDFFIRKAIGWALRNHAHVRPSAVRDFVIANDDSLSPLSKKQALKHLGGWPVKK